MQTGVQSVFNCSTCFINDDFPHCFGEIKMVFIPGKTFHQFPQKKKPYTSAQGFSLCDN